MAATPEAASAAPLPARVLLAPVTPADGAEFTRLARESAALHQGWITAPTTREDFAAYVERFAGPHAEGWLVRLRDTGAIAGFVNLNEIVRGPYERGLLGYGAFAATAGRGYMRDGLRLMLAHAFRDLRLHRLEADIQPGNERSLRLVKGLGFEHEGTSPGFIRIDGVWRDHERWAVTVETAQRRNPELFAD